MARTVLIRGISKSKDSVASGLYDGLEWTLLVPDLRSTLTMRLSHLAVASLLITLLGGLSAGSWLSNSLRAAVSIVPEPLPDMPEGTYNIDSPHSTAMFRVQHLGAGNFWGRFNDVQGTIKFDAHDAEKTFEFAITIPVVSIDSGIEKLDTHLKSPDFFNAKENEAISFKSTAIERLSQNVWDVEGNLTLNGVTNEIVALVRFVGTAAMGRGGKQRAGFEATIDIERSEFGMNYGVENGMLGDATHIVVAMEAIHDDT